MPAQKQYRNPLAIGDTVRIVGEEYHGQERVDIKRVDMAELPF